MNDTTVYPRYGWVLLAAVLLAFVGFQINMMVYPALLGDIAHDLKITLGDTTDFMSITMLCATFGYIFGGLMIDRFGLFSALILGSVLSSVPTLLVPSIGHSYSVVLALRFFQGFSPGLIVVCAPKLAALWFPPSRRGMATAIPSAGVSLGTLIALVGAPRMFESAGTWQETTLILSILSWVTLAFVIVLWLAPKPPVPSAGTEVKSSVKQVLRLPLFYVGFLMVFFISWNLQSVFDLTPSYLAVHLGLGLGRVTAGNLMGIVTIAGIIGPIIGGVLIDKAFRGNAFPVILGGFAITAVFFFLVQFGAIHGERALLVVFLFIIGASVSVLYPAVFELVSRNFPSYMAGTIIGLWMGLGNLGGGCGLLLDGTILNRLQSYGPAITVVALAGVAGFGFTWLLKRSFGALSGSKNFASFEASLPVGRENQVENG